ncbi:hypothetical protein [Algoriphagus sp.]|uniref:hypothetical protein n=1 Tax=Algoriphagus sp. TaxID=1872435 RepID=UPI003272FDDC
MNRLLILMLLILATSCGVQMKLEDFSRVEITPEPKIVGITDILGSEEEDLLHIMLDSEYLERLEKADLNKISTALGVDLSVTRDILITGKIRDDLK